MKTSKEWFNLLSKPENIVIFDPDGWDRKNFDYSFNEELITKAEYFKRLARSTLEWRHLATKESG